MRRVGQRHGAEGEAAPSQGAGQRTEAPHPQGLRLELGQGRRRAGPFPREGQTGEGLDAADQHAQRQGAAEGQGPRRLPAQPRAGGSHPERHPQGHPGVDEEHGHLGVPGEQAHPRGQGQLAGGAQALAARQPHHPDAAERQPRAGLQHVGPEEPPLERSAEGEEDGRERRRGPLPFQLAPQGEGRDGDQQQVEQMRERDPHRCRHQQVDDVGWIEEAALERRQLGEARQVVGVPQGPMARRHGAEGRLVERQEVVAEIDAVAAEAPGGPEDALEQEQHDERTEAQRRKRPAQPPGALPVASVVHDARSKVSQPSARPAAGGGCDAEGPVIGCARHRRRRR
jgi:hypothetical protein